MAPPLRDSVAISIRTMRGALSKAGLVACLVTISAPAIAVAGPPSAATGAAKNVTQVAATLNGSVNPNGEATTYRFDYGPTKTYGSATPDQGPTAADKVNHPVTAQIDGLNPGTTYHYRLVAVNASGTKLGGDKTFKTQTPPATLTLGAAPAQIVVGASTVLSGQLTAQPGKSGASVKIALKANGKTVASATTD